MTVSYQSDVASSTSGGLIRLLWRWRGSVWKLVFKELFMFQLAFFSLQILYNYVLNDPFKEIFKWIVILCSGFVDMIPLSFILGFYVSFTATRWWNQYTAIPWPDKLMNNIAMYIPGNDETSRMLRRTLMRYANLSLVLVLRSISIAVKRRFPTREHLIEAGFMNKTELDMFSSVPSNEFNTFWIPCTWFVSLLRQARQDCRITDSCGLKIIMEELNEFRNKCGLLWSYDWVSIPLVYTQVVTLATYCFFIASLFGRQHIDTPYPKVFTDGFQHKGERFVPVFSIIQFLLYMGLLKLGEQLINPFGDDDEDFELNWIIDRHIKVSFLGVDILNARPPPLIKDSYFDDTDIKLPYTAAAVSYKKKTYRGSMAAYHVPSEQQGLVVPEFDEDYEEDNFFVNTINSTNSKNQNSVWSIFNKTNKQQSVSLLSLDSEQSENLSVLDDWRGSFDSCIIDSENINKENSENSNLFFNDFKLTTNLKKHTLEVINDFQFEDLAEFKEILPQPLKIKGTLSKQSSQQSQDSNQLSSKTVDERKISDTPSLSSSILKNKNSSSTNPNKSTGSHNKSSEKKINTKNTNKSDDVKLNQEINRSSINSLKSKNFSETIAKTSLFKKADPKLRIKPFKSKVTFSDQTSKIPPSQAYFIKKNLQNIKSSLNVHLDKYDLSASSPELNKTQLSGKYSLGRHKIDITTNNCDSNLLKIQLKSGSSTSVITPSELINKLPVEKLLQYALPSTSQSSILKFKNLESSNNSLEKKISSSNKSLKPESKLDSEQPKRLYTKKINSKLKNEIPQTFLTKTTQNDSHRRNSFQIQSTQNGVEVYPECNIDCQSNLISDSKDYWLRHRSLPNIQELVEDSGSENPPSPTSKEISSKFIVTEINPETFFNEQKNSDYKKYEAKKNFDVLKQHEDKLLSIEEQISSQSAQERRSIYSKASKSSSSSNSSIQRRYRKKKSELKNNSKSNLKNSSTDSESSYYTARSVHITIPEIELNSKFHNSNDSTISSVNLSYQSANEIPNLENNKKYNYNQLSMSTDLNAIPTIVVMPTSPVTSEQNVFFDVLNLEKEDRRKKLLEHCQLTKNDK